SWPRSRAGWSRSKSHGSTPASAPGRWRATATSSPARSTCSRRAWRRSGSGHPERPPRSATLDEQLADIEAARLDLEQLVARLREEEDSRYETVFGAVAGGVQEYFAEID